MSARAPLRSLREPLAALAIALGLLYAIWFAGRAPVAPHHVLGELLDLRSFPSMGWLESFAGLWQGAALALAAVPRWPLRRRLVLLAAGVALAVAYQVAIGRPQWWLYAYSFLAGAGLVAAGFFAHEALRGTERRHAAYILAGLVAFAAYGMVTKTYLIHSSVQAAPVLDWSALKLDAAAFGFSPSAWAVRAAAPGSALRITLAIAYELLPLAMLLVFALEVRDPRRLPFSLFRGVFACGFGAALLYALTPVTGPAYALGAAFPDELAPLLARAPALLATPATMFAPRNAFPSFHLAWALVALLLAWRFGWPARAGFGLYALLIAAATLALGEHYLIDLVAALPVLAAIVALCIERVSWRSPVRRQALAGGIVLYLVWVVLLQPSWAQAVAGWPLALSAWCAANVAAGVYWLRALLGEWERGGAGQGGERPQGAVKASVP
ncbi:MAG TPA: phosphatase PAP2 family protein [Burkholderiales bacterium]|nr:phosphatase PAP2 family protein [Burkholderiales bacterium]